MLEKTNYYQEAKKTMDEVLSHIEPSSFTVVREFNRKKRLQLMRADGLLAVMAYRQKVEITDSEARLLHNYTNALSAKRYGYAYCSEITEACFIDLIEKGVGPVEMCHLKGGDHCFVLLGRNNPWGSDAIILDAWAREVYPLSDFDRKQQVEAVKNTSNRDNYLYGQLTIRTSMLTSSELDRFQEIRIDYNKKMKPNSQFIPDAAVCREYVRLRAMLKTYDPQEKQAINVSKLLNNYDILERQQEQSLALQCHGLFSCVTYRSLRAAASSILPRFSDSRSKNEMQATIKMHPCRTLK